MVVRSIYVLKVAFALALCLISLIGQAQSNITSQRQTAFDTLAIFKKLCSQISDYKGAYTLAGVINIKNPTNPALEVKNVSFLFCKSGSEFYYKLGTTETLNENGVYLYIDHDRRNIMFSAQKQVAYDQGPLKTPDVSAMLKSEHYRLLSSARGDERTITLLNEHHVSCKQYSLTFDNADLKLRRLFMRLTNLSDPGDQSTEEVVDVRIIQWDKTADLARYLTKNQVVRISGKNISGTGIFKNYKVIKM